MQIRIINEAKATFDGNKFLIGIPSNLATGKKDIYFYRYDTLEYVGYVSSKEVSDVITTRDKLLSIVKERIDKAVCGVRTCFMPAMVCEYNNKEIVAEVRTSSWQYLDFNINSLKRNVLDFGLPTRELDKIIDLLNPTYCRIKKEYLEKRSAEKIEIEKEKIVLDNKKPKKIIIGSDVDMTNTRIAGNVTMGNNGFGFNFDSMFGGKIGQVVDSKYKLGMNGEIAIQGVNGDYTTASKDGDLTNVNQFAMDMGGVFILPVTIDKIVKGDIILRNGKEYLALETGTTKAVDLLDQTKVELVPVKNMLLGKEFVRVVKSPFSMFGGDNKMMGMMFLMNNGQSQGGMLGGMDMNTLMLMAMLNGDKGMDMSKLMPLMFMGGMNGQGGQGGFMQMMAMSSLMGNGGDMFGGMFGGMFGTESPKEEVKEDNEDLKEELKTLREELKTLKDVVAQ